MRLTSRCCSLSIQATCSGSIRAPRVCQNCPAQFPPRSCSSHGRRFPPAAQRYRISLLSSTAHISVFPGGCSIRHAKGSRQPVRLRRVPGARVQVIQLLWHPPGSATGCGAEDELNGCVGKGRWRQGVARSNGMQDGAQGTRCGAGRSQELNSHMRASAPLNMFDLPLPLAPTDKECAVRGSARAGREARAQKQTENLRLLVAGHTDSIVLVAEFFYSRGVLVRPEAVQSDLRQQVGAYSAACEGRIHADRRAVRITCLLDVHFSLATSLQESVNRVSRRPARDPLPGSLHARRTVLFGSGAKCVNEMCVKDSLFFFPAPRKGEIRKS